MRNFREATMAFLREEEGLTVVEYAIAGGLVSLGVVLGFTRLGDAVRVIIEGLAGLLEGAAP